MTKLDVAAFEKYGRFERVGKSEERALPRTSRGGIFVRIAA